MFSVVQRPEAKYGMIIFFLKNRISPVFEKKSRNKFRFT